MVNPTENRLLVTGGYGFLGKHLCKVLSEDKKLDGVFIRFHGVDCNLLDADSTHELLRKNKPSVVFHLAGYNGGISWNLKSPLSIFYQNTVMGLNLINACCHNGVKKVVSVVASCAYPDDPLWAGKLLGSNFSITHDGVLDENLFLEGKPHPSVACHGYAKRNLLLASKFAHDQYGLDAICVCPTTLYGPGDTFDPSRTKVMGAMVKRFVDAERAGIRTVECWGSGNALREFLYVEDCARMLALVMGTTWARHDIPINLGSGQEISMKDLAELVAERAGYRGTITWNTEKPDGQMRKRLDNSTLDYAFPNHIDDFTPLATGIDNTISYYKSTL